MGMYIRTYAILWVSVTLSSVSPYLSHLAHCLSLSLVLSLPLSLLVLPPSSVSSCSTYLECLEMLGVLVQNNGLVVCQPSPQKAVQQIAPFVGEKDSSVRNAALNTLVIFYENMGEAMYKHVGRVSPVHVSKVQSLLRLCGAWTERWSKWWDISMPVLGGTNVLYNVHAHTYLLHLSYVCLMRWAMTSHTLKLCSYEGTT